MHLAVRLGVPAYDFSACTYVMKKMYVRAQNFVHDFVHLSVFFVHEILYMYKSVPPKHVHVQKSNMR